MMENRLRRAARSLDQLNPVPPPLDRLIARRRHRRIAGGAIGAVAVVLAVLLPVGLLSGSRDAGHVFVGPAGTTTVPAPVSTTSVPSSTSTSLTVPSTSVPPTSTPAAPLTQAGVVADLPVVVCPTSVGIASTVVPPPPSEMPVTVPASLGSRLAVYRDRLGRVEVLAPRGWSCTAIDAADGSAATAAYPEGETVPSSWSAGWSLPADSSVTAVIGSETSACAGCTLGQACPLFVAAAAAFQSQFGRNCPTTRPSAETVSSVSSGVDDFTDPPGVTGSGMPSGGRYAAYGVMTYYPGSLDGSWMETCTLPSTDRQTCTTALDDFLASYGTE